MCAHEGAGIFNLDNFPYSLALKVYDDIVKRTSIREEVQEGPTVIEKVVTAVFAPTDCLDTIFRPKRLLTDKINKIWRGNAYQPIARKGLREPLVGAHCRPWTFLCRSAAVRSLDEITS